MKRLFCLLLIITMLLSVVPVFSYSAATGNTDYHYGVIEYIDYDDYHGSVALYITGPGEDDFTLSNDYEELYLPAVINGTTFTTFAEVEAVLVPGASVRYRIDDVDLGDYWQQIIVEIQVDSVPNTTGTYAWNGSYFDGLPATQGLPVIKWEDGWPSPVYLDTQHEYDIQVYDYAVLVSDMWALNKDYTIYSAELRNSPDKNLNATFDMEFYTDAPSGTLNVSLLPYGSNVSIADSSVSVSRYSAKLSLTDLPDRTADYMIKVWIDQSGRQVTPTYEFFYHQEGFWGVEGTITAVDSSRYEVIVYLEDTSNFSGGDELYFSPPAIVDGVTYSDLSALKAALTARIGSYIRYVTSGYMSVIVGSATWSSHGYLADLTYTDNGMELKASVAFPDGETKIYTITDTAEINGSTFESISGCYSALASARDCYILFNEENDVISALKSGPETCTQTYAYERYDSFENTFYGLPAAAAGLPIYYRPDGVEFAVPYLDEHHTYNINYYEGFAVEITRMMADGYDATITQIDTDYRPDESFTLAMEVTCELDYFEECNVGAYLEYADYSGDSSLTDAYVTIDDGTATMTLTGLPNETADYILNLYVSDNNLISPSYNLPIHIDALPVASGTVLTTSYNATANRFFVTLEEKTDPISCSMPFFINEYSYTDVDEMNAFINTGRKIEYMLDRNGRIGAVRYDENRDYLYGYIQPNSAYALDENGDYYLELTMLLPDLTERVCRLNTSTWINGHRYDWDGIRDIDYTISGSYATFATVGATISFLKLSDSDALGYRVSYDPATQTFVSPSLPDYDKNLPIYCCMDPDYEFVLPYLDANHYYTIDLYDYAIKISKIESKNTSATITGIKPVVSPNASFQYDVNVSVNASGVSGVTGWSLHAQLLDAENRVVQTSSTTEGLSTILRNIPNRPGTYTLRTWLAKNGSAISPIYSRALPITRSTIHYGTLIEDSYLTGDGLRLRMDDPALSGTVTTFCTVEDTLPGTIYQSLESLQEALKTDTMVRYVTNDKNKVIRIEILSVMNAITGTSYNEETKKLSTHIHLESTEDHPVTGTIYAGVYNKDNILKKTVTLPNQTLAQGGTIITSIHIEGVDYEQGDYVKVHFWTEDNAAIASASELEVE